VEEKEHSQCDQGDCSGGNFARIKLISHAKGLAEAHGVGRGLALLKSAGRAHRINDLVDVEESEA